MSKQRILVLAVLMSGTLVPAGAAAQGTAFSITNGPYPDARLERLDLMTGEMTSVGEIGHKVTHIVFDSAESLYGVDAANDQLLLIDTGTGAGTPVGPLGVELLHVSGLAFGVGDRLWMSACDDTDVHSLFEIDTASGAATWIGEISPTQAGSLASDAETLYSAEYSLATVDDTSGVTTPVGTSTFGIWYARATDFDNAGHLRALMVCGPCATPWDVLELRTINPTTGEISSIGPYVPHGAYGLAILHSGLFFDGFESGDTSAWGE